MNYRHAFHAGNLADVMKHAVLTRILVHLRCKDAAFRVVDTHAGIGLYDLAGEEAGRTGEWRGGVGRLDAPFGPEVEALLAPFREVLRAVRERHGPTAYPGSPEIVRTLLRRQDRAVLVEKHPADAATLTARYNAVPNLKVLTLDGWTALGSLVPPPERRGLVLVDPPYEEGGEIDRAVGKIGRALVRWPTGTVALWYPVKHGTALPDVALPRPSLRLELLAAAPAPGGGLAGSGLLVVNPPWTLAEEAAILLPALAERLRTGPGAGALVEPREAILPGG